MKSLVLASLAILVAIPSAWAQEALPDPAKKSSFSERLVTRRVDDLLRGSGTKIMIDQDQPGSYSPFQTPNNKVIYHTSRNEKRLVRIEIEPIGEEAPGTSRLAATFLTVLEAVDSVDDGMRLAGLLSAEFGKDGLTRSIALGNGVKFMKEKKIDSSVRYIIDL